MKNSIVLLILLFITGLFSAQEIIENTPESKKVAEIQKLMQTRKVLQKPSRNFSNLIAIPSIKPKDTKLYTILVAPINRKDEYKILNILPDISEFKQLNLVKK